MENRRWKMVIVYYFPVSILYYQFLISNNQFQI